MGSPTGRANVAAFRHISRGCIPARNTSSLIRLSVPYPLSTRRLHTLKSAAMRNGNDYRESLRDGRKVWVLGEGRVDDVATHPATRGMVDEYAAWYDRQLDAAWSDLLISPPGATEAGTPLVYILPMNTDDLVRMGKVYAELAFITAGNVTHDP